MVSNISEDLMKPVALASGHPLTHYDLNHLPVLTCGAILMFFTILTFVSVCHPWDEEQGFGERRGGVIAAVAGFIGSMIPGGGNSPDPYFQGVIPAPVDDIAYSEPDTVVGIAEELNERPRIVKEYPPHEVDKIPELIWMMYPSYPAEAEKTGINGKVVLEILVDERGYPIEINLQEETPKAYGFGEATRLAAESAVFKPAVLDDETVRCRVKLPVEFNLDY